MRDNIFRSTDRFELRETGSSGPMLTGHFARFNEWTTINSIWEGRFVERLAPGAFKKTIQENRDNIRVLFQHGRDPQVGDKPLGTIEALREDGDGAYYEVRMLDTSYNQDLLPGLRAGLYGASFRMRVVREDIVKDPAPSDYNPEGLPERTIREVQVQEFGPVTFPAYDGATAGVRSLTDDVMLARFAEENPEKLRALLSANSPLIEGTTDEPAAEVQDTDPVAADEQHTSSDDTDETPDDRSTSHMEVVKARHALMGKRLAPGRRA